MKKAIMAIAMSIFLATACGCAALLVGTAAGAGTAVWLSGKLSQVVQKPYENVIEATRPALESLKLEITKETKGKEVTQIKGNYTDGREFWVDIRPVTEASSKIEVRVGMVSDKNESDKILKRILQYL